MMMTVAMTAPRHCPACSTELYPIARLRPRPGLSPVAKLLLAIGVMASSAIFIGGMAWGIVQRERYEGRIDEDRPLSGRVMGFVMLFPALVPGLIMGWIAYRVPKSLKLRCPRCTWRERFQIGNDGQVIARVGMPNALSNADRRRRQEENRVFDQIDTAPPAPPAAPGGEFDVRRDDAARDEVNAWVYGELARGRMPEDVAAELVGSGWDADVAEGLAEQGRKRTRHLRP
jgi:hypothetical protein